MLLEFLANFLVCMHPSYSQFRCITNFQGHDVVHPSSLGRHEQDYEPSNFSNAAARIQQTIGNRTFDDKKVPGEGGSTTGSRALRVTQSFRMASFFENELVNKC